LQECLIGLAYLQAWQRRCIRAIATQELGYDECYKIQGTVIKNPNKTAMGNVERHDFEMKQYIDALVNAFPERYPNLTDKNLVIRI